MTEELITFKTAKLAKEKGFNQKVLFGLDSKGERIDFDIEGGYYNWNNNLLNYSAPTQSLLQRWLREEHNIHLLNTIVYDLHQFIIVVNEAFSKPSFTDKFKTYELALEPGLIAALKLIK